MANVLRVSTTSPGFIQELLKIQRHQVRKFRIQTIFSWHMEGLTEGQLPKQRIVFLHLILRKRGAFGDWQCGNLALVDFLDTVVGDLELLAFNENQLIISI